MRYDDMGGYPLIGAVSICFKSVLKRAGDYRIS